MSALQQIIAEEAQIHEAGYTLGAFNRHFHFCAISNALQPLSENGGGVMGVETGHLQFVRGKGIRKTEEADCSLCWQDNLNDGKWHDPKTLTKPEAA